MDCHLVSIEVSIKGGTNQRMDLDGATFNKNRLKGLNTKAMESWGAIEQNRPPLYYVLQHLPNLRSLPLHEPFCAFDTMGIAAENETIHDKGLKQLQGHPLRQSTLVQLELRTNHDHRASAIIHPLAKKVLAESSLLALEHIR